MSRAMELLRSTWPGFDPADRDAFVAWANAKLVPNMDYFIDKLSAYPRQGNFDKRKLMYGEGGCWLRRTYLPTRCPAARGAGLWQGYSRLWRAFGQSGGPRERVQPGKSPTSHALRPRAAQATGTRRTPTASSRWACCRTTAHGTKRAWTCTARQWNRTSSGAAAVTRQAAC